MMELRRVHVHVLAQGGGSHGGSALGDGDDAGPPDGFDFTDELSALAELEKGTKG